MANNRDIRPEPMGAPYGVSSGAPENTSDDSHLSVLLSSLVCLPEADKSAKQRADKFLISSVI